SDDAAVGVEVEYVDLWVMQADGSQPRLLMQSPLDGPGDGSFGQQEGAAWCWSPDGGSIAIEWPAKPHDPNSDMLNVEVVDVLTGQTRALARGSQPAWSPDGRRLVFLGPTGLATIGIDGNGLRTLVRLPVAGADVMVAPSWSPDGKAIAYWTPNEDKRSLMLINANGHSPPRHLFHTRPDLVGKPEWSRDSRSLLVSDHGVWLVPVKAGSKPTLLAAKGFDADWQG